MTRMDGLLYTSTVGDLRLEIKYDSEPQNPREIADHLAKLTCWHPRYTLGDQNAYKDKDAFLLDLLEKQLGGEEAAEAFISAAADSIPIASVRTYGERERKIDGVILEKLAESNVIVPLYLYDHSGISISAAPFAGRAVHAEWDSGQVGWAHIPKEAVIAAYGAWDDSTKEQARETLCAEVREYDAYLSGECYSYEIIDTDYYRNSEEAIESGFFIGDLEDMKKTLESGMYEAEQIRPLADAETERLKARFVDRLCAEHDAFDHHVRNELKAEDIVDMAYQITVKYDLAAAADTMPLTKREYETLLSCESILDTLYEQWMRMDTNQNDAIIDCAKWTAKQPYLMQKAQARGDAR